MSAIVLVSHCCKGHFIILNYRFYNLIIDVILSSGLTIVVVSCWL